MLYGWLIRLACSVLDGPWKRDKLTFDNFFLIYLFTASHMTSRDITHKESQSWHIYRLNLPYVTLNAASDMNMGLHVDDVSVVKACTVKVIKSL